MKATFDCIARCRDELGGASSQRHFPHLSPHHATVRPDWQGSLAKQVGVEMEFDGEIDGRFLVAQEKSTHGPCPSLGVHLP